MKWIICIALWCWAASVLIIGSVFLVIGKFGGILIRYGNNMGNVGDELSQKKMFKKKAGDGEKTP